MKDVLHNGALEFEKGSQNLHRRGGDCFMIYAMALGRKGVNK
jgi:hypothetical protein